MQPFVKSWSLRLDWTALPVSFILSDSSNSNNPLTLYILVDLSRPKLQVCDSYREPSNFEEI